MKVLDKKYIPYVNLLLLIFVILLIPVVLQKFFGSAMNSMNILFGSIFNPVASLLGFSVQESIRTHFGGSGVQDLTYVKVLGFLIIGFIIIFVVAPHFILKKVTEKEESEETGKGFTWYFGYAVIISSLLVSSTHLIRSAFTWQNTKNSAKVSAVHDMIRADLASVSFDVANRILTESYLGEGNEKTTAELLAELKASGFPSEYSFVFEESSSDSLITIIGSTEVTDDGEEIMISYKSEVRPFSDDILKLRRMSD